MENEPGKPQQSSPLLSKKGDERVRTPTKNVFLPLGMILYAVGVEFGGTTFQQYTYNYTSRYGEHLNKSWTESSVNVSNLNCGKNLSSSQNINEKNAANWILYIEVAEYLIGLPVIALVGIYSDFLGRKYFIILAAIGASFQLLVNFVIIYFDFKAAYFLIGAAVSGITGTHSTFYMSASTLVADTTGRGKSRSFHIAMVDVYIGIGMALASMATGYMIHIYGFAVPCAAATGFCLLASLVLIFEKETLTDKLKSERLPFLQSLQRFYGFFQGKGFAICGQKWRFIVTFVSFIIILSPLTTIIALRTLYVLGEPFCFSSELVGNFGAIQKLTNLLFGTALLRLLHCCIHDEAVIIIGVVSGVSYFLTLAFSTSEWMIFMAAGTGILSTIPVSLLRGIMSRMVSEKHQGAMFALQYFCEASTRLASSPLFLTLYGRTQNIMRGFVFFVMAAFYIISCLLFMPVAVLNIKDRRQMKYADLNVNS